MKESKKFYQKIFFIERQTKKTIITLLGIRIKFRNQEFYKENQEAVLIQNTYCLNSLKNTNKLILFLVPNQNNVSGGVISIFHLCQLSRELEKDALCLIATIPGNLTYARNNNFKNDEQVYRWEQIIKNGKNIRELVLHVPEYYASRFYKDLKSHEIRFLKGIVHLHINIMNQNIDLMPKHKKIKDLYKVTNNITQTTGFERYTTQDVCNRFKIPLYYVPSFINLNYCVEKDFKQKKKLILYSSDFHSMKHKIIQRLQDELPDFELKEVRDLTYEQYLELIADALFCISFGEGFDGYYIQPYYAKSIGISVYNNTFFINPEIKKFSFVYESYEQLYLKIIEDIRNIYQDEIKYKSVSKEVQEYFIRNINKKEKTLDGLSKLYIQQPTFMPKLKKKKPSKRLLDKIQESIDLLKAIRRDLFFNTKKESLFLNKLYFLIKQCSFYYYPDDINSNVPCNFAQVLVERSYLRRLKRRVGCWKILLKRFDLKRLEKAYDFFEDERSKEIFLMAIMNQLYNVIMIRFPLFYSRCFDNISKFEKDLLIDQEEISLWFGNLKLKKYDLSSLGYDIKLWYVVNGLIIEFIFEQYRYKDIVTVCENDNVIDGGGCYGDAALHFATKTKGKVFSFEFMEENLDIFRKNIELNPKYKNNIEIIERPLGEKTDEILYSVFNGPGTSISTEKKPNAIEFNTITIDDFVKQNNIKEINFIKLDVEGSEEAVLKGAIETIKKFKPKLAICAYHKKDDLIVLPNLIKQIVPEYKLYLDHHTIRNTETVIYAKAVEKPILTAIIFTYNHKNSIKMCIESIVNQKTSYPYEIHIWDDCSIDGTSHICREYAQKYPEKIKLIVQEENTFLKDNLKLQSYAAIQNIKTKYFCIIDGDDYWCDENKLQIAIDFLENHPEYIGFAHDTLQINEFDGSRASYIHQVLKCDITNPVMFSPNAPFLLTSSRIFRKIDFDQKKILPIDYILYYYHLSKGPIYYYDKIMAVYVIGRNNTFANLAKKIRNLNSMFSYRLSLLFDFKEDGFCTELQRQYDLTNGVGERRHQRLCFFKKVFGIKYGWILWFVVSFALRYGFQCMNINYVYSRRMSKRSVDQRVAKEKEEN